MRSWIKRSGHGTVVAYLALFLAIGGGAFAVASVHKQSGKKLLKKRSTPGNRLKKHTITGTEVNLAKLGKVPTAANADTAGVANVANSLANLSSPKVTRATSSASGVDFATAQAAATPVVLYDDSHFQIYGKCFIDNSGPTLYAYQYIATKQNGAIFDSDDDELNGDNPSFLDTGSLESQRQMNDDSTGPDSANMQFEGDTEFEAVAADGYILHGVQGEAEKLGNLAGGNGLYGAGDVCLFSLYTYHS